MRRAEIPVAATDPDGNQNLVFQPASLPAGLTLQDLGGGRAVLTGTPSDPVGSERWLRRVFVECLQSAVRGTRAGGEVQMNP